MECKMKIKFVANPRMGRLEQITTWLREERTNNGTGFYCNMSVINKAFKDREAFCATVNNVAIGFCVFSINGYTARIDIAEICPAYRGAGVGRFLVENSLKTLASRRVQVVDLQCEPRESENFWRHMQFTSLPEGVDDHYYSKYNKPITLFRPVCEVQEEMSSNSSVIELFDCESWKSRDRLPKWSWPVLTCGDPKTLIKPIIHPSNSKWELRWKIGDTIVKADKVKNFCSDSFRWGNYVILTKLPELPRTP